MNFGKLLLHIVLLDAVVLSQFLDIVFSLFHSWICRKDWKLHNTSTGGFFRCNRWTEEEAQELYDEAPEEVDATVAALNDDEAMSNPHVMVRTFGTALHATRVAHKKSKEMQRFLHHYTRWNAHSESATLEKKMSETVCTRLAPVVQAAAEFMCDENFDFDGKGTCALRI